MNIKIILLAILALSASAFAYHITTCQALLAGVGTMDNDLTITGTCFTTVTNAYLDCVGHTITGNLGTSVAFASASKNNVSIRNCIINNVSSAVSITGTNTNINISTLTITNTSSNAISISGGVNGNITSVSITNTNKGSGGHCIQMLAGTNNWFIYNTTLTNCGINQDGYRVDSSGNLTWQQNVINSPTEYGIWISSPTAAVDTINGTNISSATIDGMRLDHMGASTVNNTIITTATGSGINVTNSGGVASGLVIWSASMTGIGRDCVALNGATVGVVNGLTCQSSNIGLEVFNAAANNNLTGIVFGNGTTGIYFHDASTANNNVTNGEVYNATQYINSTTASVNNLYNFKIGKDILNGVANWTGIPLANEGLTQGLNMWENGTFLSMDAPNIGHFNTVTTIRLPTDAACLNQTVYKATGFPSTREQILTTGLPDVTGTCGTGFVTFTVGSFSGYTIGGTFNLTLTVGDANETANRTMTIVIDGLSTNITAYNATVYYNNTLVYNQQVTGINQPSITINQPSVIAPLVNGVSALIPWNITVSVINGGLLQTRVNSGNQTVTAYYILANIPISNTAGESLEAASPHTITFPGLPDNATLAPTYAYNYYLDKCIDTWAGPGATNTTNTTTCNNALLSGVTISGFTRLPSHRQEQTNSLGGINTSLIKTAYALTRQYNLSFSQTPESTSTKTLNDNNGTIDSDLYVWLVDGGKQTSRAGYFLTSANPTILLNTSVLDEISNAALTVDTYSAPLQVEFDDNTTKNYNITYASVSNTTVEVWPRNGTIDLYGYEEYDKSGYTTRRKIYANPIDMGTVHNYNQFLLSFSAPGAVSVQIIVSGQPDANYVKVFKKVGFTNRELDDRFLSTSFNTFGIFIQDAFYQVSVYDNEGNLLTSQDNMQVDCSISCRLVISGSTLNTTVFQPFSYNIECNNNVTLPTNSTYPFNQTPSSGSVVCKVINNPGNYTFVLNNYVGNASTCTNSTIGGTFICPFVLNSTNLWQVVTTVNGIDYVVGSGSFTPYQGIILNQDASIIFIMASAALAMFIWSNVIIAGIILMLFNIVGGSLNIIPFWFAVGGAALGFLIFLIGVFKRK